HCARIFGKDAGLFVPSGSMGNEVCLAALTAPGEEVIVEEGCHIIDAEVGAPATINHVILRPLGSVRGVFDLDELAAAIRPPNRFFTHTSLMCVENTHQAHGGAVIPIDSFRAMCKIARERGVRVHLDGARIFNASVASGVPVSDYAVEVDTLSFCFSKGLGAPIGSMVVGPTDVVDRARRARKMFGGGMRQVGVIAAAARLAVDTMVERLHDDHVNARRLGDGLASFTSIDPASIETNIVYVDTADRTASEVASALAARGVNVGPMGTHRIRMVTHKDVDADDVERAVDAFRDVLA
ncbi:MAG: low specificity L-threonine aldolase, partial [Actinomycetota bacterium]